MIAVDTNVLIYAHRRETDLNAAATAELVRLAEGTEPWALPVFFYNLRLRFARPMRAAT